MLQEADPTGEGCIRLPGGGAPFRAEAKEGYWDGPYEYLEKNENGDDVIVTSTQGYKVDVSTKDISNIIWYENGNLDRIKKRVRYDLTYLSNDERLKSYWNYIEEEASYARDNHERSLIEWTERTIEKYFSGGCEVRQPIEEKIGMYNRMKSYNFLGVNTNVLCQGESMAIIESGQFYYETKDKYYVWKCDPEKGKNWSII